MKKTALFLLGAIAYIVLSYILSSYGNKKSHPLLNDAIVDVFTSRYSNISDKDNKFYNYNFLFSSTAGLRGEEISIGGIEFVDKRDDTKNVKEWISHGGFSADEPQLPASFRHFYDPTEPPGERYLKDLLDSFYAAWGIFNPHVDHVEWGISHDEHEYNYEAGKKAMESAILEPDEDIRKEHMAFAWRALGETLHLIADMGIACHVRDDAHPALLGQHIDLMGGPDPYEEICEAMATSEGISSWLTGSIDPSVKAFTKNSKTAKSIAEQLAGYTNANFFSNHTISGQDVKPKAHPDKDYDSPKLEDCEYDKSSHLFMRNIGGNAVKMCKDHSYWHPLNDFRGYPYVDKECTISQAKALAPQIVEAGVNVIRCFIPRMEVKINELTADSIKGEVIHHKDIEYPTELKYNGWVTIRKDPTMEEIDKVLCEDGKFICPVNLVDFDRVEDKLYAEIECGYIYVKSEIYEDPLFTSVGVRFTAVGDGTIIKTTGSNWGISAYGMGTNPLRPFQWDKGSFSSVYIQEESGQSIKMSAFGELSSDLGMIEDLRIEFRLGSDDNYSRYYADFINVPTQIYTDSLLSMIPDGQGQQYVQELQVESVSPEKHSVIKSVNWANMRIIITFRKDNLGVPLNPEKNIIYLE